MQTVHREIEAGVTNEQVEEKKKGTQDVKKNEGLLKRVLYGISCRGYKAPADAVPGAIGISKSSVSRKYKEARNAQLKAFQERSLADLDIVALCNYP